MTSVAVPGVTVNVPSVFCVNEAAGTVICPASVVGVVCALRPCRAVVGDGDVAENGGERVGDDNIARRRRFGVAGVGNDERVGDLAVFRNGRRRERLADGELGAVRGLHRRLRGDRVCETAAGDRRGVRDRAARCERCDGRRGRLIDEDGAAAGGDRETGHGERRPGGDGRRCLQNAVNIIAHRSGVVGERVDGVCADGIAAEIIGDGIVRDGRCAGVHERESVGDAVSRRIVCRNRRLDGGESFEDFAGDNVRVCCAAVIGKRGEVGKACHSSHSKIKMLRRTPYSIRKNTALCQSAVAEKHPVRFGRTGCGKIGGHQRTCTLSGSKTRWQRSPTL